MKPLSQGPPSQAVQRLQQVLERSLLREDPSLSLREVGYVSEVESEVAWIEGLPNVGVEELVEFPGGRLGLAFDLGAERVGVILLDDARGMRAGALVGRTHRVMDTPVGDALLGRVVDPAGRPLDGRGPIRSSKRLPIERKAVPVLARAPVTTPLETGIKVIDALVPVGRGQRELIVGDRQTGKTTIAVDTILHQRGRGISCVYCAIGQQSTAIARVVAHLRAHGALEYCTVVATTGDDPAGLQFIAPYAATSMAESFAEEGRDALIVYDDLTNHARAYRELSLLLRRPPGREAYPGDIFYLHARLLERSTHLRAGGSLTALPIIATEEENISAYIPTNLISITDGQIYLSPKLFRQGVVPAVDVGRSVSRVGGDAQLPAYHAVSGPLRIRYSQFEELERFSRYGTKLDAETRKDLERGRRIREVLKQGQSDSLSTVEQLAVLFAVSRGLLDHIAVEEISTAEQVLRRAARKRLSELASQFAGRQALGPKESERLERVLVEAIESWRSSSVPPVTSQKVVAE